MAETLRIEIPIETVDETEPELSSLIKKITKLGDESEKAGQKTKRSSEYVTEFEKRAKKTESSLARWAKEEYEILLEAKDRITPILHTVGRDLRGFFGKTWSVTMKAVDVVTAPVRGILNILKNPIFQAGAVLGVSIGLADTVNTYKDFEAAMSQVQAISNASESDLTRLTDKAKEMGATTKFTAEESAEAFNYMAMAGWKTEDMLDGIEGILSLAAASGEELGKTSDIVTDGLTAFNMKASEAGHFSDVLAVAASSANTTVSGMGETFKYAGAMAGTLGYQIEDVALATGLMANAGIKGTMAGTAINSIMTRMSTDTNGARSAIEDLGVAFYDTHGNARDFSDVLGELRKATAGMNDEQKMSIANTIAGMEAQKGLLAILNASEEDYENLSDAISHADGAASRMSETMMDNLQGSIYELQSAVDGVKISFGERLSPYMRGLADWLTDQMPAVERGLNEFMDWLDVRTARLGRKFQEITGSKGWQNADFFEKVKITWDEFIVEPFSEWWNNTGKAKFAGFAQNIGSAIGSGIRKGVMTLLGIDLGETLDEGVSIGASFAKGFSEGFDFDAVSRKLWDGFKNLLSSAGKLLPGGEAPDLSSVVSAIMLSKIAKPFVSVGKGAAGIGRVLFGENPQTGISLASAMIGSTGNAMVSGSGILGQLANVGYGMSGGSGATGMCFGNMARTMSGGPAALIGAGTVTSAVAGIAAFISGILDMTKALKIEDKEQSDAYGKSAAWKMGGAAAGAAIGTLILPGVGTAVGAGIGGIAGWVKGNKVKEDYQKEAEEIQKEAVKAQKAFEATGLSIDEVTFKNRMLTRAMNDSEVSAEQFALLFERECEKVASEAFGDVALSLEEIKNLAGKITFADMAEGMNEFASAASNAEETFGNLEAAIYDLKRENWKAGLGLKLSERDSSSYEGAIDRFVDEAKSYIENNHYEATAALHLLMGDDADTGGLDAMYISMQEQVDELSSKMNEDLKIYLSDGIISLDEQKELENLQNQIMEITSKLSAAKQDATMDALKVKYTNGAGMDAESFASMQEELKLQAQEFEQREFEALVNAQTNLRLQLQKEGLGDEERAEIERQIQEAADAYTVNVDNMNVRLQSFQFETIATAFAEELDGILPDLKGTTEEKLMQVMQEVLAVSPDASMWETGDIIKWFDLGGMEGQKQAVITDLLKQTALTMPDSQLIETGAECAKTVTDSMQETILVEGHSLKRTADHVIEEAFAGPHDVRAMITITPEYSLSGGPSYMTGLVNTPEVKAKKGRNLSDYITQNAAGGYVSGGPQLSWLAEEGYGEFVIPTNPSRRSRALELYEQAGAVLGVSAHAAGGYVGGSFSRDSAADYQFYGKINRNAPMAYHESIEDDYGGKGLQTMEPAPMAAANSAETGPVQVNVNVSPEFVIHAGDGQKEEDILQIIKRHMKEMADELGGEIAEALSDVFSNMPTKEA